MNRYWSCHEKLWKTARLLAILDKRLKPRLIDAYNDQLCFVEPSHMPPHLKDDLVIILDQLTKNHTKPVNEVIHPWKISKVRNIADNIFALYCRLSYHYHSGGET